MHPTISAQMAGFIEDLIQIGSYGNNDSEVAAYLIQRALDDLLRAGVLKPKTKESLGSVLVRKL